MQTSHINRRSSALSMKSWSYPPRTWMNMGIVQISTTKNSFAKLDETWWNDMKWYEMLLLEFLELGSQRITYLDPRVQLHGCTESPSCSGLQLRQAMALLMFQHQRSLRMWNSYVKMKAENASDTIPGSPCSDENLATTWVISACQVWVIFWQTNNQRFQT